MHIYVPDQQCAVHLANSQSLVTEKGSGHVLSGVPAQVSLGVSLPKRSLHVVWAFGLLTATLQQEPALAQLIAWNLSLVSSQELCRAFLALRSCEYNTPWINKQRNRPAIITWPSSVGWVWRVETMPAIAR